jgi:pyruvate/2-oxoacid:ferredoxin oxidoreductase beta subunit/NADPH-dependent glutamate synthase beta subunit-like oxidoreductase/NAD-dependent dihydropyrimidine dehydrogenase PreA subunit/ferredoxin
VSPRTKAAVMLTIDGKALQARDGETVLTVARREGIDIPALCHEEGMAAWGACRLCLVEVEGLDKLQAACTTWVKEGMEVKTYTPRVKARRESYLKMYLSDHNAYCEAPCSHACPTHVDIPAYMAAMASGDAASAAAIVREELPFPGILGRVCPRYCEPACRRGEVDDPIAICALHRAAADNSQTRLALDAPTGRRVAIIGAGPAGLAAAWFLAEQGHDVTVYDAHEKPGGSLRYSIPEFRLPEKVVDKELAPLWEAGVRFIGESELGFDIDPDGLFDAGFDAVLISIGTWDEPKHVLTGDDAALRGLDVLKRVREGRAVKFTTRVAVIGDGITALDVARTARRKGAKEVVVIASHEGASLPAGARDLAAALEEGIKFEFGTVAKKIKAKAGKAQGVECVRVVRERGRTKEVKGSRFDVAATTVVLASGYAPRLGESAEYLALADGVRLQANFYTGRTPESGVFAAGDAITGPMSVIHAVAGGKRSALAVDAWLRGEDLVELEEKLAVFNGQPYLEQLKDEAKLGELGLRLAERGPVWLQMGASATPAARAAMPTVGKVKRLSGLDIEVEKGLGMAAAQAEAERCLQCVCPSLGDCELQRLGVEYGVTSNELVSKGARVREVQDHHEHPFIRRDMDRCIACGRCVRVCRDVAGPACYDFTGRGFDMNVDAPYGEALQLADCITCGRCKTACPTGAITFNERALGSFRVDESRCIVCKQCVDVCPVDALKETNHFEDARQKWLELVAQGSKLAGGHRMCAGCGAPIVVRQILMGTSDPVVVSAATGCLEVSTTIYPYTSWKGSYIHTAFENAAATLSGVETAYRSLKKKGKIEDNVKFIAFGGDGGTYDIGLQSLSGAMERGHSMLYVCYDNGAYMNTGFQRSGATPVGAWTTTSPVGKEQAGKLQNRKNLTDIMIAHGLKYVAQASPHDPRDLVRKAAKALSVDGPTFLNVLSPCPRGWRSDGSESIELAREAVNCGYWPLFEVEDGEYHLTYRPHHKMPLAPWLKRQGRFAHLFKPGNEETLLNIEAWVDNEWEKLLRKCGEPSEADWQEYLQSHGCLLR